MRRAILDLLLALLIACQAPTRDAQTLKPTVGTPTVAKVDSTSSSQDPVKRPDPRAAAGQLSSRTLSVRALLKSSSLVGQRVRVKGHCLGERNVKAAGRPPLTRSD